MLYIDLAALLDWIIITMMFVTVFVTGFASAKALDCRTKEKEKTVDDHFFTNPVDDPIYQQTKRDRPGPNPFI